jgi:cytochrome c-type biogenesis protein CcmE
MTHRNIKIAATVTVLVAAFVGLMYSTLREGTEYYKHVDEVMTTPQQWEGKRLQLHGFVVPGSIYIKPSTTRRTRASCPIRSRTIRKSC